MTEPQGLHVRNPKLIWIPNGIFKNKQILAAKKHILSDNIVVELIASAAEWCNNRLCLTVTYPHGSGHETVAVLLPGFAINW